MARASNPALPADRDFIDANNRGAVADPSLPGFQDMPSTLASSLLFLEV
jgi:hypothetical protein